MFSRYSKKDAVKATAKVVEAAPKASEPDPKAPSLRRALVTATAAPQDKEIKRKSRLSEIKVEVHSRLLDSLNLAALENASEKTSAPRSLPSPANPSKKWALC